MGNGAKPAGQPANQAPPANVPPQEHTEKFPAPKGKAARQEASQKKLLEDILSRPMEGEEPAPTGPPAAEDGKLAGLRAQANAYRTLAGADAEMLAHFDRRVKEAEAEGAKKAKAAAAKPALNVHSCQSTLSHMLGTLEGKHAASTQKASKEQERLDLAIAELQAQVAANRKAMEEEQLAYEEQLSKIKEAQAKLPLIAVTVAEEAVADPPLEPRVLTADMARDATMASLTSTLAAGGITPEIELGLRKVMGSLALDLAARAVPVAELNTPITIPIGSDLDSGSEAGEGEGGNMETGEWLGDGDFIYPPEMYETEDGLDA